MESKESALIKSVFWVVGQQYPICGYGNTFLNGFFARIQNHIIALVMVRL